MKLVYAGSLLLGLASCQAFDPATEAEFLIEDISLSIGYAQSDQILELSGLYVKEAVVSVPVPSGQMREVFGPLLLGEGLILDHFLLAPLRLIESGREALIGREEPRVEITWASVLDGASTSPEERVSAYLMLYEQVDLYEL